MVVSDDARKRRTSPRKQRTSPLSVRLGPQERELVEMVAEYMDQTTSDFVRSMIVGAAKQIVVREGADKIVQVIKERREQAAGEQHRALEETAAQAAELR